MRNRRTGCGCTRRSHVRCRMRSSVTDCGWARRWPEEAGSVFFGFGSVRGGFTRGARLALAGFGDDLDIELLAAVLDHAVDQAGNGRKMDDFGRFLGRAELAVEVPEVRAFWQYAPPLALD